MGVDLVSIANNHMLDRGEKGLLKSIRNLDRIGLEYDGGYKSFEDQDRLRIFKTMVLGFVSYLIQEVLISSKSQKINLI